MDEKLIGGIYDAALEPQRWGELLREISQCFGGAAFYLGHSNPRLLGHGDIWTVGFENGGWGDVPADEQSSETGAAAAYVLGRPLMIPIDRRSVFSDAELERHPIARTFLQGNGLFHAAICLVQADAESATVTCIGRGEALPIEGDELYQYAALMPHLGQAMRTHRALRRADGLARSFREALDRLDHGVALIDRELRVAYANAALEGILETELVMRRRLGRLSIPALPAQRALETAARRLTDPCGGFQGAVVEVPDPDGTPAYTLTLAPALGDATSALAPQARILVFVTDERRAALDPPTERLEAAFGLSSAEARVAALAAQALRPPAIADALAVSENTVKSHLKSIYDKLGVRSLAGLVRAVLTLPR